MPNPVEDLTAEADRLSRALETHQQRATGLHRDAQQLAGRLSRLEDGEARELVATRAALAEARAALGSVGKLARAKREALEELIAQWRREADQGRSYVGAQASATQLRCAAQLEALNIGGEP